MKYEFLLFDADDTLLDFHRAEHSALTDTLLAYDLPCNDEIISIYSEINASLWRALERGEIEKSRLRDRRFELLCERFDFKVIPSAEMSRVYTDHLSEKPYTIDGALDLCRKLSEKYKMYIVTNGLKTVQSKRFASSGLSPYFIKSFISEDVGFEKPNVRYFEMIAKQIPNFDKSKCLIIGDSLTSDIKGGDGFGIDTCWYNPKNKTNTTHLKITYEIRTLCELEKILLTEA